MKYGDAIEALKAGNKVSRKGWNGKGMYLVLAKDITFTSNADLSNKDAGGPVNDSVAMRTADGSWCVGWLSSQADMLSEDWTIVK